MTKEIALRAVLRQFSQTKDTEQAIEDILVILGGEE